MHGIGPLKRQQGLISIFVLSEGIHGMQYLHEQKREIIRIYGDEHESDLKATEGPVPQQNKVPCRVRDMKRQFRLYNPNFFYFFWYDSSVGRWRPKLGEAKETKRRQTRKARATRKARQAMLARADRNS